MKKLKCDKCSYIWHYKGKSKIYVTCPQCLNKVKIKNGKIQDDEETETQKTF